MSDRPLRVARTPILLWRWRLFAPETVYHAVQPLSDIAGPTHWEPACHNQGDESFLDVDGTERCLQCFRALARPR
jgi:hypothetical protein